MLLTAWAMSDRKEEVVRGFFDAYNRGDFDAAAEFVHPNVEMVPPGDQPPYRGRKAVRKWMEPDAFAEQTAEVREFTEVAERVLVEAHSWLTGAGSGINLEVDFWSVLWIDDDGLLTRCEILLDRQPALNALRLSDSHK